MDWLVSLATNADTPDDLVAQSVEGNEGGATSIVDIKELLTGRLVVTLLAVDPNGSMRAPIIAQVEPLLKADARPVSNLCGAILLARAGDYSRAGEEVDAVIGRVEAEPSCAPPDFLATARIVKSLIGGLATSSTDPSLVSPVTEKDSQALKSTLGWYGELLLSTAKTDPVFEEIGGRTGVRLIAALFGFFCIVILAGLGGITWLIVVGVRYSRNVLADPLRVAITTAPALAWTFAGWFLLTMAIAVGVAVFASREDRLSSLGALFVQVGAMALPLLALAIPLWVGSAERKVSWTQIRQDVGLHCGAGFWREIAFGFTTYAMAVPLVMVGAVFAIALSFIVPQGLSEAGHPIQKALADGDATERLLLLFIAAVAAPIVEEIVFRGVLYMHLRDMSRKWGRGLSFLISALASSLIFAAIHPQGIVFIPILGALAVAFCLARELRGTLIPSMVGHAINNALIVGLNIALTG